MAVRQIRPSCIHCDSREQKYLWSPYTPAGGRPRVAFSPLRQGVARLHRIARGPIGKRQRRLVAEFLQGGGNPGVREVTG
jgi:hypothetical protein